ncbi:MAG: hypothetical protein Q8K60_03995 [Parachlamydiaceae bacterium]|nr:hypothetical protein [Parachlamydiaceae bacterium]
MTILESEVNNNGHFDLNYDPICGETSKSNGPNFNHHKIKKNPPKRPFALSISGLVFMMLVFIYAKQIDNVNPRLGKALRFVVVLSGPKSFKYAYEYFRRE